MSVPAFKKKNCRFHLDVATGENISSHGGQIVIDALATRFDLWNSLASIPGLDPRNRRTAGFSATSIVAQMILGFTSGAASLADMERVGSDRVLMELVGLSKGADQSTLGEWLRAQTSQTVAAVMAVNRTLVSRVLAQATPGRVLLAGRPTVFFDDTEIEVEGKCFEGARRNYEGNRAMSFQTLWVGPFVADAIFDGVADPSQHLGELLAANASLWQGTQGRFYADSASSAVKFLKQIEDGGVWQLERQLQQVDRKTGKAGGPVAGVAMGHGTARSGRLREGLCLGQTHARRSSRPGLHLRDRPAQGLRRDVLAAWFFGLR